MRRGCTLVLGVLALALAGAARAQPVLTIEEWDENNRVRVVEGPAAVVDINSLLRIGIDREQVRALVVGDGAADTLEAYLADARRLAEAARTGLESTRPLAAALAAYREDADADAVRALRTALARSAAAARPIVENLDAEGGPWRARLENRLEHALDALDDPGRATETTYAVVFDVALEQARALTARVDTALAARDAYVRMAAWLATDEGTRPVHLEGFDTLPRGEFVRVSRFSLSMTDEQQRQFEAYRRLSGLTLRQAADSLAAWAGAGGSVRSVLVDGLGEARQCASEVQAALEAAADAVGDRDRDVRARLRGMRGTLSAYVALADDARGRYRTLAPETILRPGFAAEVRADVGRLAGRTVALSDSLRALAGVVQGLDVDVTGVLVADAGACAGVLGAADAALTAARTLLAGATGARALAAESFEMTDAVLKRSVDGLPEGVDLWLAQTGPRRADDVLVLRMVVAGGEGEPEREVAYRQLTLLRVLPHLVMAPALVFAYRASGGGLDGRFQAAPSYSVLLKAGGRRAPGLVRLVSPGIGLNVSTLDFDNDDDLEVGFGVVVSLFRDYVQGGYGFNVQRKTGYPFFGVNLPLASVNVGL